MAPPQSRISLRGMTISGPTRRHVLAALAATSMAWRVAAAQTQPPAEPWAARLIAAARAQIGVTTGYNGTYEPIAYPMGDVPRDFGVCTDVVIRAYRDGLGLDLQRLVHEDMVAHRHAYPNLWGHDGTDTNIDHRRVPNLRRFFERQGGGLKVDLSLAALAPGDVITMTVPPSLPHIAIIADRLSADGQRPLMIHNIGRGTQEEDATALYAPTGHYRWHGNLA